MKSSYVIKLNSLCNLRCSYCYYIDPRTGRAEAGARILPLSEVKAAVDRIIDDAIECNLQSVFIAWHGGEPLINGAQYFRSLFDHVAQRLGRGVKVQHKLQSNLTLIDEELIAIFKAYDVEICTSIDGPAPIHDARRVDAQGRGTFWKLRHNIATCREAGLKLSCLTVIDPDADGASVFNTIYDLGLRNIDFLLPDSNLVHRPPEPLERFERFLISAFDAWCRRADPTCRVNSFDSVLRTLIGLDACACTNAANCDAFLSVEANGHWGVCDTLRGCGRNVQETSLHVVRDKVGQLRASDQFRSIRMANALSEKCRSCPINTFCGGGCAQSRWDGSSLMNTSVWCSVYWGWINHMGVWLYGTESWLDRLNSQASMRRLARVEAEGGA